jgi:hypothetical protein
MPPKGHALLSASSSKRWLSCPPSARLNDSHEDVISDYAAEGTDAHMLFEHRLREALGMETTDPTEHLTWFNEEMNDYAADYVSFILEQIEAAKQSFSNQIVLIEQHVDFSRWVESGFGTADCIIVSDGVLQIYDLKYGRGIEVSAKNNPQLKCYALGALDLFDGIYDIETVRMGIYQPRLNNISISEVSKNDLYEWAEKILKPTAALAYVGEGTFRSGSWCTFCKVKNTCRARAEANLELARLEFELPPLLTDEEVEEILSRLDDLITWASDIKEYALQQALLGKEWHGYKIVEGRSNRHYTNETSVAETVKQAGFDPYEHKVLGITAMQKLLGKSRFEELLSAYIEKPLGKPTLVPESDKRPVMNTVKNDFTEVSENE